MRTIMLWGGGLGFFLAAAAGFAVDRPLDLVLRDAAIACLAGAWLLRWWWSQLERALTETVEIRRRRAEAAVAAEEAAKADAKHASAAVAPKRRGDAEPALVRSSTSSAMPASART